MSLLNEVPENIEKDGFVVLENIFSPDEVVGLRNLVENDAGTNKAKSKPFAIRRFFKAIPGALPLVFTKKFTRLIEGAFGSGYFIVKTIFFDKPPGSNWFVAYHQDLSISVDRKAEVDEYRNWCVKGDVFSVHPPASILENNFTIRIHLDETDAENGALRVVPGSHRNGVVRPELLDRINELEAVCKVPEGGVMIMRPLLLHASRRTTNERRRRVIHLEFSKAGLPPSLEWAECVNFLQT